MDLQLEVAKIVDSINYLHSSVSSQNWQGVTRTVFVVSLDKTIDKLKDLREQFKKVDRELEKGAPVGKPEITELMREFDETIPVLENNLKMEKSKKSRAKEGNVFESEVNAEMYSELSQRVETLLLRSRYMAERLNVFTLRQSSAPLTGQNTARQMLDLLQTKEKEIEELRSKYEDVRKKSYLGLVQEQTSADLEQDLGNLAMKMGGLANALGKEISVHKSQIEYIENSYAELKQRLDEVQGTFDSYVEKSLDLISMLKKERDYAKKVVLDVEHETLQLRNTYTNEVLSLQENKLKAKKEAETKFRKELEALKKQLKEKEEMLHSFRKLAEEKAEREKELEDKIKHLTLLLKTKEKHEAVKKRLKKRTKKKK